MEIRAVGAHAGEGWPTVEARLAVEGPAVQARLAVEGCPVSGKPLAELIDVGVAHRVLPGERESGDAHVVMAFEDGVLIGVIDGLGHGPEAAQAARLARRALLAKPAEDVGALVRRCHAELRYTRGAVMTLASIRLPGPTMTWVGVGNVEGRLIHERDTPKRKARPGEAVLLMGGVVGHQLPPLKPATVVFDAGDTLMLATDGLRPGALDALLGEPADAQQLADSLLESHGRDTDDVLVLVARYDG